MDHEPEFFRQAVRVGIGATSEGFPPDWHFYKTPGLAMPDFRFCRHTHVANGRYCITTMGDFHPGDCLDAEELVACGHFYQTTVYDWQGSHPLLELASVGYDDAARAHDGHIEVCYAWDRKAREEQE